MHKEWGDVGVELFLRVRWLLVTVIGRLTDISIYFKTCQYGATFWRVFYSGSCYQYLASNQNALNICARYVFRVNKYICSYTRTSSMPLYISCGNRNRVMTGNVTELSRYNWWWDYLKMCDQMSSRRSRYYRNCQGVSTNWWPPFKLCLYILYI